MKIKIKGIIEYKMKKNHPDLKYVNEEERDDVRMFSDTYTIDMDYFWGMDHVYSHIKRDLALVAGGGYDTDTIKNVKYKLIRI